MSYRKQCAAAAELTTLVAVHLGAAGREEVSCPRERSAMTPCVARDGASAVADVGVCVGCGHHPADLLHSFKQAHP